MSTIKTLREAKKLSQQQLAELAETSQPQIFRLENGSRKMTKEWAERLAPILGVSPQTLLFDEAGVNDTTPVTLEDPNSRAKLELLANALIQDKIVGQGVRIPIYGQAVGGVDGEFLMNGNILYEVMAPPVISHISGAYGVQVSGDSMWPRYEDGEICFVDPKRRLKKGDYVIAQIRFEENGPILAYVKKFCRHNAEELILEQFNPAKELRFPAQTVVSVHFIALAGLA